MKVFGLALCLAISWNSFACDRYMRDMPPESHFQKYDHILNGHRPKLSAKSPEELAGEKYDIWQSKVSTVDKSTTEETYKTVIAAYEDMTIAMNSAAKNGEGYYVVPMKENYHGENNFDKIYDKKVKYVTPAERDTYKVTIKDGIFYRDNKVLNTEEWGDIFVMDHSGEIYVMPSSWRTGDFSVHHSSVLGGMPVASAGEMIIVDGKLIRLNDQSGHYRPPAFFLKQAKAELASQHVDLDAVKLDDWDSRDHERMDYLKKLGVDF